MADGGTREAIRQDLEHFWDAKLQRARKRYVQAASEFHRQLLESGLQATGNISASADIRREEAAAFADYCRVLAAFTELVAIGKLPKAERGNAGDRQRPSQ
ncbi:MAG TPA: hypothetical protein VKT49_22230 [Bryobacteraceae bacterium]|nr:hypothetical protein [Bryobacteraceae bacterium]